MPARRPNATKPDSDDKRVALARDLQKELKRVGCYDGEINGWWNAASKHAMSVFTERVNASLPVEEPDYILLALVQSHNGTGCSNQRAVVAQQDKKPVQGAPPQATSNRTATTSGQVAAAPAAPTTPRTWETGVFPAARPVPGAPPSPVAQQPYGAPPVGVASAPPAYPNPPFPGRMAVGTPPQPGNDPYYASGGGPNSALPPGYPPGAAPQAGWETVAVPPPLPPLATESRRERDSGRSSSQQASGGGRRKESNPLRTSQQVKDFFFGPGRASF